MTDHNDLIPIQRYTRQQAAELLNIRDTWLKVWVTGHKVPHQRSGKPGPRQRGVWFTYDDILAIGRMLPGLMTGRQANGRAERHTADDAAGKETDVLELGITDDDMACFLELKSLRGRWSMPDDED